MNIAQHQQQFHHQENNAFLETGSSDSNGETGKFNHPGQYQAPASRQYQSSLSKQQESYNKVTHQMWAQKVDYQHGHQPPSGSNSTHDSRRNSAQPQRKSSTSDRHHGAHQGRPVQSRDRGHSIELPQKSSRLDANLLLQTHGVGGSTRHSVRTSSKAHAGHHEPEGESLLNQTQIVQGTSHNDRSNRMNIRQSSRQNPRAHQTDNSQVQQRDSARRSSNHGSKAQGADKGDSSFQTHYEGNREQQALKSEFQDKFYHNQKADGVHVFTQIKSGSSANQKSQVSSQQQQQLQQRDPKAEDTESEPYMPQSRQASSSGTHQPAGVNHRRRSTENVSSASYGTSKKKVQPPQPRNRNEASQHRRSGDSNSAQTQPQQHGKHQNEQQSHKTSSHNVQSKPQGSDRFSQLVCQVPQGSTTPQMATSQPTPTSAAGQAFAQAQAAAQGPNNGQQEFLLGPQRKSEQGRKTLVLDLDETLVHSSFKPVENPDITLPVEIDGQVCIIYVLVRPLVAQFLKRMHKLYELVIFTASLSKYAEPLMQQLDPSNMCVYKLFREHCTYFNNAFVKDLTRLGRPMTDVIILDNSPVAYLFQPENAMPAVSWYDDQTDTELARVATLLERMAYEDDVRKVIRSIIVNNKIDPRQEQLYLASTSNVSHRRDKSQRADRRTRPSNFTGGPIVTQNRIQEAVHMDIRDARKDEKKQREVYIPEENEQSQASNRQSHNANATGSSRNQAAASHSRYDSSDTRQKHAAIIIEQINQRKRGNDMKDDLEGILQNAQSSSPNAAANDSKTLIQKLQNSSNEIKQAYDHHKQQILQLKNEIAVLKGTSVTSSPTNAAAVSATQSLQNATRTSNHRTKTDKKSQQFLQEQPVRNEKNSDLQIHNGDGQKNSSGGKPRESSKKQRSGTDSGVYAKYPEMPDHAANSSFVFKDHASKRGDNSRYARDQVEKNTASNHRSTQNSKPANSNISKHELQLNNYTKHASTSGATHDKKRDNNPVNNTKQVIKLIKKNDNHSNNDVTNTQQYHLVNEQHAINLQPQSQTSQGFRHPATTKNNKTAGMFAFNSIAQNIQQQLSKADENNRGSVQPYSHSQINMISSHSNQPSRISSKTVKNTTSNPKHSQTLRTSQLGTKHREHGASSQTTKNHTSGISTNYDRQTNPGTTKRPSSVKNANRQSHDVQDLDGRHRKGSHSQAGYNNLAGSYTSHHQKRERGSSAQPIQSSSHYSHSNQLIVQNVGQRSSSTTNKNKKSMSTAGVSQGLNNLFNGSHSTKHSHHHGTTLSHHQDRNGQLLSTQAHSSHHHKGSSSDRHQTTKASSSARQSSKGKASQSKTQSQHDINRDSRDHQRDHQQMMMQYQQRADQLKEQYNQFNATQKIQPSAGLSLGQYQPNDQTRQTSNLQVMHDMLRLTQQGVASTRHSKKHSSTLLTGGVGSPQNGLTSDDFLKKIKMQQDSDKHRHNPRNTDAVPPQTSTHKSYTMLQQQQASNQSGSQATGGLTINSPKYGTGQRPDPAILTDILNLTSASTTNAQAQRNRTEKPASQIQPQIKKMKVSSSTSATNGRNTSASNQSHGVISQSNHGNRGHSASRGSTNTSSHHHNRHQSDAHHQQRGNSGSNREQSRKTQQFNQTMKFSSTTGAVGGVNALLNELSAPTPTNHEYDKQTAANLFLQSQQHNQIYQTSYFGNSSGQHGSDGQLGQNQLREVTRHFYNQLALEKKNNQ